MLPAIIAVDLQHDFTRPGGTAFRPRPSVDFIRETVFPFLADQGLRVAEIGSDYRQPHPGAFDECRPGTDGHRSEVPDALRRGERWLKCMHSPLWTRTNIGEPDAEPGPPFQDPAAFDAWLSETIGSAEHAYLIGLTLDCCVLCLAQELCWRDRQPIVIEEATDTYSGSQDEKRALLESVPFSNWSRSIAWGELVDTLRAAV